MNNPYVLAVDDNTANLFVLSTMLKQMGFEVDEASSGVEAINMACHKDYCLIVMDHLMPDMDGIQTIKQIQFVMRGEECPAFIGASATLDDSVRNAFAEVNVQCLVEKPIRIEALQKALAELGIDVNEDGSLNSGGAIDIEDYLAGIEGLDYEKGIDLMAGSTENYMKVLGVCVKNVKDNLIALDSVKETSRMDAFALHFHSLKGIFLNIGADSIAEESRLLEMAAKEDRLSEIKEKITDYMDKVQRFGDALELAADKYTQMKEQAFSGEEMSTSEYVNQLRQLKQHIEDFEYIEITELLEQMIASSQGERKESLNEVSEAIQDFDYDKAIEIIDSLEQSGDE